MSESVHRLYRVLVLYVLLLVLFIGGLYLLAREYTAVHKAVAYAQASTLWDVSQSYEALHSFRLYLVGYAVGLTLLMVLLTYMTGRHLHSEQARREAERRIREVLQQPHDALERHVEERTADLVAAECLAAA